jgi:hypothetical protein
MIVVDVDVAGFGFGFVALNDPGWVDLDRSVGRSTPDTKNENAPR